MKICKLIREHSFKDIRIFEKEARSLTKLGHDVTIVAGKVSGYVFGPDMIFIFDPTFRQDQFVYKDVNFLTYDLTYPNANHIKEMVKALAEDRQDYFIDTLFEKALSTKADVYHAHEWHTLYEAVQIKRFLRKRGKDVKVIFDAHELETDSQLLALLMKEVDHLITVSDSIKEIYKKRYPEIPITIVYNTPLYQEKLPKDDDFEDSFVIAFEGVVVNQKGNPQKIIDIANLCNDQMKNFRFKIFGRIPTNYGQYYKDMAEKIKEHPLIDCKWIDYYDLPKELNKAHVGYIYFDTSNNNRIYAMPNKFFSYLNNGVPVVVNQLNDMKKFIEAHQCGIVIDKTDPTAQDYVEQFLRLYQDRELLRKMSENAREAMKNIYCWEKMEERLAEVYNSLK